MMLRKVKGLTAIILGLSLASLGLSQTSAPGATTAYLLHKEDVIRIQVYNEPQATVELPVDTNGNISAPFVGTIHVAGKSTADLEKELVGLYQANLRLREPKVSVVITRIHDTRATVGGQVQRPGTVVLRPGDTLVSLLNAGGGAITDRADLRRATLRRANSNEQIPIDLYAMTVLGDTSQNYVIEDGDELNVPEERRNRILVLGIVQRPGVYQYHEPMTLADALSLAGGEVPTRSWQSKIRILRESPGAPGQYMEIHADFIAFITKNQGFQNVPLQAGDVVYIPEVKTPDLTRLGNMAQSILFFDSILRGGLFGFRLFR